MVSKLLFKKKNLREITSGHISGIPVSTQFLATCAPPWLLLFPATVSLGSLIFSVETWLFIITSQFPLELTFINVLCITQSRKLKKQCQCNRGLNLQPLPLRYYILVLDCQSQPPRLGYQNKSFNLYSSFHNQRNIIKT